MKGQERAKYRKRFGAVTNTYGEPDLAVSHIEILLRRVVNLVFLLNSNGEAHAADIIRD